MRLSKLQMFFAFNGGIAFILACYIAVWVSGKTADAVIITPFAASRLKAVYEVKGKNYEGQYLRLDIPFNKRVITIRYLSFAPSYSRVSSFMGIALEPLAWWLVFLLASSMLLLTNNVVFSKGAQFHFHRKFPWISMDEFFRVPWYYRREQPSAGEQASQPKHKELDF